MDFLEMLNETMDYIKPAHLTTNFYNKTDQFITYGRSGYVDIYDLGESYRKVFISQINP